LWTETVSLLRQGSEAAQQKARERYRTLKKNPAQIKSS